jgi:hypothetical protein
MTPHRGTPDDLALYAEATADALTGCHHGSLSTVDVLGMLRGVGLDEELAQAVLRYALARGMLVEDRATIRAQVLPVAA